MTLILEWIRHNGVNALMKCLKYRNYIIRFLHQCLVLAMVKPPEYLFDEIIDILNGYDLKNEELFFILHHSDDNKKSPLSIGIQNFDAEKMLSLFQLEKHIHNNCVTEGVKCLLYQGKEYIFLCFLKLKEEIFDIAYSN